jgi:hypothetical protein
MLIALVSAALLLAADAPPEGAVETLTLQHRLAEDVLPELIPLVEGHGAITGADHQIFVRASADRVGRVKERIVTLDVEARGLWISIRQVFDRRRAQRPGALGAQLNPDLAELQGAAADGKFRGFEGEVETLRAHEGEEAFVAIRRDLPLARRVDRGTEAGIADEWLFESLGAGFYVVPHVATGEVRLEIVTRHGSDAAGTDRRLQTSVAGRLGEWVEIGRVLDEHAARAPGAAGAEERADRTAHEVLVKVDLREPR